MNVKHIIKEWMLPIAMMTGASIYLIYHLMPEPVHRMGPVLSELVGVLQPLLIFAMLFLTFCRIEPRELKPHRWHWWLLLIQGGLFVLLGLVILALRRWVPADTSFTEILIECAMLCFICPTATAAAVVTRKLGGDIPGITTYIVLINILTAVLVPLVVPVLWDHGGLSFWPAFNMIMAKVFPLLITPCLCAWLVRYLFPRLHRRLMRYPDLPFYLWSVALTLAIALTTKAIVHSGISVALILSMSAVSLVCCAFQFAVGRCVGGRYGGEAGKITAGQSMGQKNTVFAIWLAYTFMTPVTAIVGGLYSIWHNIYNSWQLRHRK
jgi:BASS family bile acid:Na+ symporter